MPTSPPLREPKASRVRVWQAVERIVRSGRRPTIGGVRELLGGGSPNSITAYVNDWYQDLGSRLAASDTPMPGLPPEAVSLLTEIWRVAAGPRAGAPGGPSVAVDELRDAERAALLADAKALETMNKELQRHRSTAERALVETRALLARREAALEEERSQVVATSQALAQARLDLEIARERRRLAAARVAPAAVKRPAPKSRAAVGGSKSRAGRNRLKKLLKPSFRRKAASTRRKARGARGGKR